MSTTECSAVSQRRDGSENRKTLSSLFKRKQSRELTFIWLLLLPALALYFFYRAVPLIWNLVLSFCFWAPGKPLEFAGL